MEWFDENKFLFNAIQNNYVCFDRVSDCICVYSFFNAVSWVGTREWKRPWFCHSNFKIIRNWAESFGPHNQKACSFYGIYHSGSIALFMCVFIWQNQTDKIHTLHRFHRTVYLFYWWNNPTWGWGKIGTGKRYVDWLFRCVARYGCNACCILDLQEDTKDQLTICMRIRKESVWEIWKIQ